MERIKRKTNTKNVTDTYARHLIKKYLKKNNINRNQITLEMTQLKRQQVMAHREFNKLKEVLNDG